MTNDATRAEQDLADIDLVFNALAHRSRRTILSVLLARGGAMTSGQIADRFDCAWPTTSRHLRVLERAGLVRIDSTGRERRYELDRSALTRTATRWLERFRP